MNAEAQRPQWSRWLKWTPKPCISANSAETEPTKPTEQGFDGSVGTASHSAPEIRPLEDVLKGRAVELYADGDMLFIVADEDDAERLGRCGATVYTLAEVRLVVQIADPLIVAEVHRWKKHINGTIRRSDSGRMD